MAGKGLTVDDIVVIVIDLLAEQAGVSAAQMRIELEAGGPELPVGGRRGGRAGRRVGHGLRGHGVPGDPDRGRDGVSQEPRREQDDDAGVQRRLGERLKKHREYLGMSQQYVAECTGIPRTAVRDIERGRRRVDAVAVAQFARL